MRDREKVTLPTRDEAIENGWRFYGAVIEVYKDPLEDADEATLLYMLGSMKGVVTNRTHRVEGEVLGTAVNVIEVDSLGIVFSTLVERKYCRSQRSYERAVRKTVKQEAKTIEAYNSIGSRHQ